MAKLIITENGLCPENILYIKNSISSLLAHTQSGLRLYKKGDRAFLSVECTEYYKEIILTEILDLVAEIISVKYKYDYFKKSIKIKGLNENEKEILYTSIISADLEDDKKYIFSKLGERESVAIDGVYNFMLKALKRKWEDIVSYIPVYFVNNQLRDFVTYLLEHKKKRVYVESGRVYDSHYRQLKRADLLGGENIRIIREVILSNCGIVELFGKVPEEDERYLREFYGDKIFFKENVR